MKTTLKNTRSSITRTTILSLFLLLAVGSSCKKNESASMTAEDQNATATVTTQTAFSGQINLGTAGDFSILAKSGISTTGTTAIEGNIGVSPIASTAITGFALAMDATNQFSRTPTVNGRVYASDYAIPTPSKMTNAVNDMEAAYTAANNLTSPTPIVGLNDGDISGKTLKPGIYKWSTGLLISETGVTLSGGPNDTWVFQIAQDLTLNSGARITLKGGAQAKNITWVVGGQATLGTTTHLCGTVLSKTLISLNTGADVTGRLFAQTAVTLNASTLNIPK
jgi:hypothetical protein